MITCQCGSETAACTDCGKMLPINEASQCPDCSSPMDCTGCLSTVSMDLNGTLKPANDDT